MSIKEIIFSELNVCEILDADKTRIIPFEEKIKSIICFPFKWIAEFFENLAWSLVDPNSKAFKAKSVGHLVKDSDRETFDKAVERAEKVFDICIETYKDEKNWDSFKEKKGEIFENKADFWPKFSKQYKGSCTGNTVTMAHAILSQKHFLTINELQTIEKTSVFKTASQAMQLIENMTMEYSNSLTKKEYEDLIAISEKQTFEEIATSKINELDLEEKFYNENKYIIKKLAVLDFKKEEIIEFLNKKMKPIESCCHINNLEEKPRKELIDILQLKTGNGLIQKIELFPEDAKYLTVETKNFKRTLEAELKDPHFKGIVHLAAISKANNEAHAMLLEIDNQEKKYILYDNNRGFYEWNDLSELLFQVKLRLMDENYSSSNLCVAKLD